MYQGGETSGGGAFNGNQRSIMGFNRAQIASDFAGFTVTQCTLKLTNQHSWFNSGMTFQVDEYQGLPGSAPGSYPASAYVATLAQGTIAEGATHSYNLGSAVGQRFATGSTNGLGLGKQIAATQPYNLNYYGFFSGGHGVALEMTITGTQTVAGSTTSGQGSDGKATFTYAQSQAMVFALSAVASTDNIGNAFAAGYTGPVNVFQPGVTPAVVETWHDLGSPSGAGSFTKIVARYRLMPGNAVRIEVIGSFSTSGTATFYCLSTD
jgi:hypothetical protein